MKTMVYLPDRLHKAIKHLAVERGTSIASLVREALEALYKDDIEDMKTGRERFEDYLKNPDKTTHYSSYRQQRIKS